MPGMFAGYRLDDQRRASDCESEAFVSTEPSATVFLNGAALAVLALTLFFSTYALADNAAYNYRAHCAACHGATGAGETMIGENLKLRSLGSPEVQAQSDEELFNIISKGKGKNRMPAFDRRLSKDQMNDIVKYVRSLKK
jgi:mono/diheme cytochrome c family protein